MTRSDKCRNHRAIVRTFVEQIGHDFLPSDHCDSQESVDFVLAYEEIAQIWVFNFCLNFELSIGREPWHREVELENRFLFVDIIKRVWRLSLPIYCTLFWCNETSILQHYLKNCRKLQTICCRALRIWRQQFCSHMSHIW